MTERPIILSGESVRGVLAGWKTMTRRVCKPQPADDIHPHQFPNPDAQGWISSLKHRHGSNTAHFCPYGVPGGQLWVRESFNVGWLDNGKVLYRADGGSSRACGYPREPKWSPSIHMPRWASRLTLEIVSVRVERLQEIPPQDAIAEGIPLLDSRYMSACWVAQIRRETKVSDRAPGTVLAFAERWDSLYGKKDPWASNPWVWVISFRKVVS